MYRNDHRPTDEHSGDQIVVFDIESIVEDEPADGSFPKWPLHRPVVASFLAALIMPGTANGYSFRMSSVILEPGGEAEFYAQVNQRMVKGVTTVGFNSKGYDLPVLQLGAIAERRFDLTGLSHHARSHRFGRDHCDLAELYSLYGATKRPSLAEVCDRFGIPIKTSTSGGDVGTLWHNGDVGAIQRYCEEDVAATYCAWLHHHAWRHGDETLLTRPLAAFARYLEADPQLAHLLPFARQPAAIWARPRALACSVAAALADADRRVRRAADERAFGGDDPIF